MASKLDTAKQKVKTASEKVIKNLCTMQTYQKMLIEGYSDQLSSQADTNKALQEEINALKERNEQLEKINALKEWNEQLEKKQQENTTEGQIKRYKKQEKEQLQEKYEFVCKELCVLHEEHDALLKFMGHVCTDLQSQRDENNALKKRYEHVGNKPGERSD
jgi:hypothetical protein